MPEDTGSLDYVRLFEGKDGKWYYESRANNHQVLSTSEGYTRKEDAVNAMNHEYAGQKYTVVTEEAADNVGA